MTSPDCKCQGRIAIYIALSHDTIQYKWDLDNMLCLYCRYPVPGVLEAETVSYPLQVGPWLHALPPLQVPCFWSSGSGNSQLSNTSGTLWSSSRRRFVYTLQAVWLIMFNWNNSFTTLNLNYFSSNIKKEAISHCFDYYVTLILTPVYAPVVLLLSVSPSICLSVCL